MFLDDLGDLKLDGLLCLKEAGIFYIIIVAIISKRSALVISHRLTLNKHDMSQNLGFQKCIEKENEKDRGYVCRSHVCRSLEDIGRKVT